MNPPKYQFCPPICYRFIPILKLIRVPAALGELFEQRIALGDGLRVFAEDARIRGDDLSEGLVEITAAFAGIGLLKRRR